MNLPERAARWCVFLPCKPGETWAVPQNCLGEIVTLQDAPEQPPSTISWREHQVPVLDLGQENDSPWRESHGGTGRIAVFLGLNKGAHPYWGLALRGEGLAMDPLVDEEISEVEEVVDHALGAFRLRDRVYQIPDLAGIPELLTIADADSEG